MTDPVVMRAEARVGVTLRDKWRLDRLLGVGGMAAVYAATHRNGSRGAIKMLHLELSLDAETKRRFLREGYVANTVDHPGVVRVLDDDVDSDGSAFLVMELLAGETLDARWERSGRRLDPAEALCALDPVLSTLVAAHQKGVVHRDIKPENIFICHDGVVKLLDFGIARLESRVGTGTAIGMAMGTPAYMPPEQALGRTDQVGPHSDLWALGATLFTVLTGTFVHRGETSNEQLIRAATEAAPRLQDVDPTMHPAVAQLVDVALAWNPGDRWADAAQMQEAARAAYHALAGSPVQTAPKLIVPTPHLDDDEVVTRFLPQMVERTATTGAAAVAVHRSSTPTTPGANRNGMSIPAWAVGLGALAMVGVTVVATAAIIKFGPSSPEEPKPPATSSNSVQAPSAAVDVPSVPVVTPVAPDATASASAPPQKATVSIRMAGSGTCTVTVGPASYGPTPVEVELPAGKQRVSCTASDGTLLVKSIVVVPGRAETLTFAHAKVAPKVDPMDRRKTK